MEQKAADLQNVDSAYDPCRTAAVLRVGQSQPADRGGAIDNAVVRLIKQAAITAASPVIPSAQASPPRPVMPPRDRWN
jgi:hypothetical protein